MPSTDRKLELQANDINVSTVSQPAVSTDLASPAVSQTAVCFNGLKNVVAASGVSHEMG
jgi:hypothetical protein